MSSPSQQHLRHRTTNRDAHPALEVLVLIVAIAEPLTTLPQIYTIWAHHTAAGISVLTWGLYAVAAIVWFVYGLVTKSRPLLLTGLLWVIVDAAVLIEALVY